MGDAGMRRAAAVRWAAAFLALLVAGCTPAFNERRNAPAGPVVDRGHLADLELLRSERDRALRGAAADETPDSDAWRRRAVANALLTDYIRRREGPLFRRRDSSAATDGLPQLCLALSGGGMRALAFDAGVLYGLQRRGLYAQIDVASGVSGGGYALYWMIGGTGAGGAQGETPLDPGSEQVTHLRAHADGLSTISTGSLFLAGLGSGGGRTPQATVIAELFGAVTGTVEMVSAPGHAPYEAALDRMLRRGSWLSTLQDGLSTRRLSDLVEAGRVPLPVWLATARPAGAAPCVGADPAMEIAERSRSLLYSAFEIAPTRMGSDELGFLSHMLLPPLNALAVSAAAMSIPYNSHCELLHLADASTRVKNFPARRDPTAAPGASGQAPPSNAAFDLVDGAIADNLAVFPLVRRLCSDIIVVDAGFDPYLTFDSYGYLKQQLANLDIPMEVPALEAIAAKNTMPTTAAGAAVPCRDGVCLIRPRVECVRRDTAAGCVAADELPVAVFTGQIGPIPIASRAPSDTSPGSRTFEQRVLHVRYVKLSLDGARIDRYPASVRARYSSDVEHRRAQSADCTALRDTGACLFPHRPTAELDLRGGLFEAYWDLGRCIVERDWDGRTEETLTAACGDSIWPALKP